MNLNDIWSNPAIVGLILAIPSTILGLLAYRRSRAVDKVTEQSQAATSHSGSINQVIEGMNKLNENLQEDNRLLREGIGECRTELGKIIQQQRALVDEVGLLKKALAKDIDENPRLS